MQYPPFDRIEARYDLDIQRLVFLEVDVILLNQWLIFRDNLTGLDQPHEKVVRNKHLPLIFVRLHEEQKTAIDQPS